MKLKPVAFMAAGISPVPIPGAADMFFKPNKEETMTTVTPWVQKLVEDTMGKSRMKVGKILMHPEGYRVKVISGQLWGTYGYSNFWTWRRVDSTGKPYGKPITGYGW